MEVRQAEAEAQQALIEVKRLEILIPQTENLLSVLIGSNPESIERGRTLQELEMPPEVPSGLPSGLLEQRPDILQAEQQLIAANARVGEARARLFPQITLTGTYGHQSRELDNLFTGSSRVWQYGANLFQQLFDAGRLLYELEAVKAVRLQALYNYFLIVQTAFRQVNDALIGHEKTLELVKVLKDQVFVLQDYLRLAKLQYNEGETDYLNVLDAERKLFTSQLDFVQAQADSFISLIQLYAALGGGWVVEADSQVVRGDEIDWDKCMK